MQLKQLRTCRDTLLHRGPDNQGDWHDQRIYMGHTRLSIVDTSAAGNQPFVSCDGMSVLAVNGEIYNHQRLRDSLSNEYEFTSASDSEVLLHGYAAWGIDGLLERVEGMFAFALYDIRTATVYLVRDRLGIKPLYVWQEGAGLAWASELKALTALDASGLACAPPLRLDYTALYDYLTYLYVPTPKSLYRQIQKLEPGCYLAVDLQAATARKTTYWSVDSVIGRDQALPQERLLELLQQAVAEQMSADVPLGFFLSGGVDSSAVAAAAAAGVSRKALATFSIGFDAGRSELPYAAEVASHIGASHHAEVLSETAALDLVRELPRLYDEPFADTSALPSYLVAAIARQQVKVVLTGDGGDEVFGGYDRYLQSGRNSLHSTSRPGLGASATIKRRLPRARRLLRGIERYLLLDGFARYARWMGGLIAEEKQAYRLLWDIAPDYDDYWHYRAHYDAELPPQLALQRMDLRTYLPDDILTKVDRATMAHGLEARVPLLATPLVEAAFAAPAGTLGASKALFKAAVGGLLPPAVLHRRKQGFSVPAGAWREGAFDRALSRQEQLLRQGFPTLVDL